MAAARWNAAVEGARTVYGDVREPDVLDDEGEGTWKLVEIFLEKMSGQSIPMLDRNKVDENWRQVVLVVEDGAREGTLRFPSGALVDEADTPEGVVSLREGNHSMRGEYGMYYKVPDEVTDLFWAAPAADGDDGEAAAARPAALIAVDDPPVAGAEEEEEESERIDLKIVDQMRVRWKEKRDQAIARSITFDVDED